MREKEQFVIRDLVEVINKIPVCNSIDLHIQRQVKDRPIVISMLTTSRMSNRICNYRKLLEARFLKSA